MVCHRRRYKRTLHVTASFRHWRIWQQLGSCRDWLWVTVGGKCVLGVSMVNVRVVTEWPVAFGKMTFVLESLTFDCGSRGEDAAASGGRRLMVATFSTAGPSANSGDRIALLFPHGSIAGECIFAFKFLIGLICPTVNMPTVVAAQIQRRSHFFEER